MPQRTPRPRAPPRPIPPYPPESEREGSAPAPNRQAPPRKFSAPWAQGPGGQRENFSPKGEIFPRRRAGRGFYGGIGRAEEGTPLRLRGAWRRHDLPRIAGEEYAANRWEHSRAEKMPACPIVGQADASMGKPCYLRTETREPGVEALTAPSYIALQVTGGSMNSPAYEAFTTK